MLLFQLFFFPPSPLFFRECHFPAQNSILHIFRSAFEEIPQGSQSVSACRAPPSAWCCPALQDHCADCSKQAHTKPCPVTPGGLLVKPMVGQHQTTQSEHYPHQLGKKLGIISLTSITPFFTLVRQMMSRLIYKQLSVLHWWIWSFMMKLMSSVVWNERHVWNICLGIQKNNWLWSRKYFLDANKLNSSLEFNMSLCL